MLRSDKGKYTDKQERKAEHIEESYGKRGVPEKEATRRAWATVNKIHKGGEKKGGGGFGKKEDHSPMRRGGKRSQARKRAHSTGSSSNRKSQASS